MKLKKFQNLERCNFEGGEPNPVYDCHKKHRNGDIRTKLGDGGMVANKDGEGGAVRVELEGL